MDLLLTIAQPNATVATTFSFGSIVLIVLPSTLALVGVIIATIVSSRTAHRAEDRRSRNLVYVQVLEAGRHAQLDALYATAEFIAKLKTFNRVMSSDSGEEDEDGKRSSEALGEFIRAFRGLDSLTRAAITVEALGATNVSIRLKSVRSETLDYLQSLGPPTFLVAHAHEFEEHVDSLMRDLVDEVRLDFGTDEARAGSQRKTEDSRNGG